VSSAKHLEAKKEEKSNKGGSGKTGRLLATFLFA
jgi:hypothetical protein